MHEARRSEQPNLRFRDLISGDEIAAIWDDLLTQKLWRSAHFEQHEKNVLLGARDRSLWRPVLRDWMALEPGMSWNGEATNLVDPAYRPVDGAGSMADFLGAALRLFQRFHGKRIGVQLSGGVDSSLIIGLLRHFEIPYSLVGLLSDRYEFRTERHVQEKLASGAKSVELIDNEKHLPCGDLDTVPPHQVPDLLCLNFSQDRAMARACRRLGIDVLFSGGGGDNLLGEAVPERPNQCEWRPQTFTDPFPVDVVYLPHGVEFLSFFGDHGIVDALYRLRRSQGVDYAKLWARRFFRDFLPAELVDFTYCADFWGRDIDGMQDAIPAIREIHRRAAEATGADYFDEERLDGLLGQDLLRPEKSLYQRLEARISSAVWVNALERLLGSAQTTPDPVDATINQETTDS